MPGLGLQERDPDSQKQHFSPLSQPFMVAAWRLQGAFGAVGLSQQGWCWYGVGVEEPGCKTFSPEVDTGPSTKVSRKRLRVDRHAHSPRPERVFTAECHTATAGGYVAARDRRGVSRPRVATPVVPPAFRAGMLCLVGRRWPPMSS